jgi:hypothetical protein
MPSCPWGALLERMDRGTCARAVCAVQQKASAIRRAYFVIIHRIVEEGNAMQK